MRYELVRKEPEGTWSVWDSRTEQPAIYGGERAVELSLEDAQDIHALLEAEDMKLRMSRGHIV